jgi:hypothetical protein
MIGNYVSDGMGNEGMGAERILVRRGQRYAEEQLARVARLFLQGDRDPFRVIAHLRHWAQWVFYYRTGLNRPSGLEITGPGVRGAPPDRR